MRRRTRPTVTERLPETVCASTPIRALWPPDRLVASRPLGKFSAPRWRETQLRSPNRTASGKAAGRPPARVAVRRVTLPRVSPFAKSTAIREARLRPPPSGATCPHQPLAARPAEHPEPPRDQPAVFPVAEPAVCAIRGGLELKARPRPHEPVATLESGHVCRYAPLTTRRTGVGDNVAATGVRGRYADDRRSSIGLRYRGLPDRRVDRSGW